MANPSYFTRAPLSPEITEFNFKLYMYQWVRGPNVNQNLVLQTGNPNGFGTIYAIDWTVFGSPEPNANLVGHVRGVKNQCDMNKIDSWLVTASIVFVDQRFKGSTLKVAGSYEENERLDGEWAIVGGTGLFSFAQGVGPFTRFKSMDGGNIREFNFRVRCPTLP